MRNDLFSLSNNSGSQSNDELKSLLCEYHKLISKLHGVTENLVVKSSENEHYNLYSEEVDSLRGLMYNFLVHNYNAEYCFNDNVFGKAAVHDLALIVEDIADGIMTLLDPKEMSLKFVKNCTSALNVKIYEKAFTIAVANLVNNAFRYSPHKIPIYIELSVVESGQNPDGSIDYTKGQLACVTVRNTIDAKKDEIDVIDGEPRPGLGHILCRKVAERYGGVFEHTPNNVTSGEYTASLKFPIVPAKPMIFSSSHSEYICSDTRATEKLEKLKPLPALVMDAVKFLKSRDKRLGLTAPKVIEFVTS